MKTALLFGSTGLVGGHVLNYLIQNSNYSKIKLFVRSFTGINNPKIEKIKTDFKIGIIFAKLKITTGDDIMKSRQPSDLIVEVFAVAVSDLVALGLSREEAVLGLLSQAAVQANPGAMVHAAGLHQKFHSDFVET